MTRRITAFIVTLATVFILSACAPQPVQELTLLEKIKDAIIFVSQENETATDLSIEAIVPDADSPEVTAYIDKLCTDKGQDVYEYNFDYIKEVMQGDASTVDDALYNALIISFTNMPDEDKETFLESAYIKTNNTQKWNASPVISEMRTRCKGLLDSTKIFFYNLSDRKSGIDDFILGYSLILQTQKYSNIESNGSFSNVNVDIERVPDRERDAVLSFGVSDDTGNVKNLYTINVLAFREHIKGVLDMVIETTVPQMSEAYVKQLETDGNTSYALYMGASISYTDNGKYDVNLAAIDTFRLNMSLRAYAKVLGNDGLSCTAIEMLEAFKNGETKELAINNYIDWYLVHGDTKADKEYYDALKKAYIQEYCDIYDLETISPENFKEITDMIPMLKFEDMLRLEQDYPEYFS